MALAVAEPLFSVLPREGLAWVVAGGVSYTLGVVFFALDQRIRYAHFAWHLFVLAGSTCHFVAVSATPEVDSTADALSLLYEFDDEIRELTARVDVDRCALRVSRGRNAQDNREAGFLELHDLGFEMRHRVGDVTDTFAD
jgi:hypothetical protein